MWLSSNAAFEEIASMITDVTLEVTSAGGQEE
jgi:hypothetical protein